MHDRKQIRAPGRPAQGVRGFANIIRIKLPVRRLITNHGLPRIAQTADRYLDSEADDALAMDDYVDVEIPGAKPIGFTPPLMVKAVPTEDVSAPGLVPWAFGRRIKSGHGANSETLGNTARRLLPVFRDCPLRMPHPPQYGRRSGSGVPQLNGGSAHNVSFAIFRQRDHRNKRAWADRSNVAGKVRPRQNS